jgi:17beta-estradiol 17-dehydrogenase / very-long-chain 3-oxoacyl-CoA reductase
MFELIGKFVIFFSLFKLIKWAYSTFFRTVDYSIYKAKGLETYVLITGASDGIGLGFAKAFAERGFNLLLVGRNKTKLERVKKELEEINDSAKYEIVISEALEDSKPENIKNLLDKLGNFDIGILVNNVGIGLEKPAKLEHCKLDELFKMIQVNCTYPTLLTNGLVLKLKERVKSTKTKCAIINISSIASQLKIPASVVYCGTKAYNWAFSRSLAVECLPYGIDVLCVKPGYVESQLTGMKKNAIVCSPLECAEFALKRMGQEEAVPHWKHSLLYYPAKFFTEFIIPTKWILTIMRIGDSYKLRPKYAQRFD